MTVDYEAMKGFLDLGYADYIAARLLLNNEMFLQGASMASTALEKYLKGYGITQGHSLKGHIGPEFVKLIKKRVGLPPYVSEEFLEFLGQCYLLRYFDSILPGFNLVIRKRQLLAELDATVASFESAFSLTANGVQTLTACQAAMQRRDPVIADNNYILQGIAKTVFIEQRDAVYEIRFFGTSTPIQATYYTIEGKDDGRFSRLALVPDGASSMQMAFLPLPPTTVNLGPLRDG